MPASRRTFLKSAAMLAGATGLDALAGRPLGTMSPRRGLPG